MLIVTQEEAFDLDRMGGWGDPLYSGQAGMKSEHTDPVRLGTHYPHVT